MERELLQILMVDDDEDDHVMVRALLSECLGERFRLEDATTPAGGLAMLERQRYDVCLCDYRLGEHTGLEFLEQARRLPQCPPIIILTGLNDWEVDFAVMKAGAADYLNKAGLDARALERAIRYAVEHHRTSSALRQQLSRISLLNQTTRAVAERQDLPSIFQVALKHLEEHLPVRFGMVCAFPAGLEKAQLSALGPRSRALAVELGWQEGQALAVAGSCLEACIRGGLGRRQPGRAAQGFEVELERVGLPQLVALPLTAEQSMLAAMVLARPAEDPFSEAETDFLRALGEHISLAARHVKLHEDLQAAYHQLQERQQAALRQERLAAVGQLAAGVAHEFNNILTIIQGYASLLLSRTPPQQPQAASLRHILDGTERAARLVGQLLAFSRQQMLQPEPVDFNQVVERVGRMLDQTVEENVRVHLQLAADLPRVAADAGMLEQIVLNLAINARDAMPQGGDLVIRTALVEVGPGAEHRHPEARPGRFVCLTVADTGCGMDAQTLSRLFEPFFTTKDVGKGTGMGLATVYGIVKQHQGWIEVESHPGQGSTFRVLLPALAEAPVLPPAAEVAAAGRSRIILVVEDEADLRLLAQEILHEYGFTVLTAANGPEALAVWNQQEGNVDVLLTDMVMPGGMSGEELAAELLQRRPGLKVIYTSGYSVDFAGRRIETGPGIRFLAKPYLPSRLLELIQELTGKETAAR
ncbi:MAG: response regulator [Verrucomicrobiae bacterium]|nr:response regulator [Verrucomicrobiae bacterium]